MSTCLPGNKTHNKTDMYDATALITAKNTQQLFPKKHDGRS